MKKKRKKEKRKKGKKEKRKKEKRKKGKKEKRKKKAKKEKKKGEKRKKGKKEKIKKGKKEKRKKGKKEKRKKGKCGNCACDLCVFGLLSCGACELPTASSNFGSTGVLWVLTGTHPCGPPPCGPSTIACVETLHSDSQHFPLLPPPPLLTFTFLFFGFLVQPLPLLFFTFLPQPTAEKVFFMHGLVFTEQASVFSGQGSSAFQHSLFGDVPQPFLCHETSHLKLFPKPFAFSPGDPFFFALHLSILSHSWQDPFPRQVLGFVFHVFPLSVVSMFYGLHRFIQLGTSLCRA